MNKKEILDLLNCKNEPEALYAKAREVRNSTIGNYVYLRGLIEISDICRKDCYYCGIRRSNTKAERYTVSKEDIVAIAVTAWEKEFGSVVLQGGERNDDEYVTWIEDVLRSIKEATRNELGITLSLGEQTEDTYKRWFDAGAHRYLLRIETSNETLYNRLHPNDNVHSFATRLEALHNLQKVGYQTGSGVMIGLPFQTLDNLADDLLFLRSSDIDMVGMGPYLEHEDTPLYVCRNELLSLSERLQLSLRMIAVLRLLVPDLNIASTTALQSIDPQGREKGLLAGANVIMPNMTPVNDRRKYRLYQNKPFSEESTDKQIGILSKNITDCGCRIALNQWGDPQHFKNRRK
ncbi:MAG: [FeFe] hydrogenase H-cluster radical SAM maturase HydE [Culturomica sp.]|nr:[FeFe] hydrogenase H-cluster radical SAM maturase HydE [Culturomica sp.]